eukprot:TRINITY_DN3541_c0_g2_i1.p1 TRINITY_DN3541_c0_g2~~TRINITY_DN3541_c0_g2_i1.p1  ORF type:complete len:428 (+),score=69.00 TRINITY_DN3541_c0_g2_i1:53-1285(+)
MDTITHVKNKINFIKEEDTPWRQESMNPPPYHGVMKGIAKGVHIGDPLYDAIERSTLLCAIHNAGTLPDTEPPAWVDWGEVREGQALWRDLVGASFISLSGSLILGYSIERFSEVLLASGYGKSPAIAYERYMATGFHLQDWMRFDLEDHKSDGRRSLKQIRAMHAYARAKSMELGIVKSEENGVMLSQYDLAETLLGFSAVSIDIIQYAIKNIPAEEQRKMVAVWRLIAYFLGVTDEYNVCKTLEFNKECFMDWHQWSRLRMLSIPKSGLELQRIVVEGFGVNTPPSHQFFYGYTALLYKQFELRYETTLPVEPGCPKPLPGVVEFLTLMMPLLGYTPLNRRIRSLMYRDRDLFYSDPEAFKVTRKKKQRAARIAGTVFWPFVSFAYQFVFHGYLLAVVLCYYGVRCLL